MTFVYCLGKVLSQIKDSRLNQTIEGYVHSYVQSSGIGGMNLFIYSFIHSFIYSFIFLHFLCLYFACFNPFSSSLKMIGLILVNSLTSSFHPCINLFSTFSRRQSRSFPVIFVTRQVQLVSQTVKWIQLYRDSSTLLSGGLWRSTWTSREMVRFQNSRWNSKGIGCKLYNNQTIWNGQIGLVLVPC